MTEGLTGTRFAGRYDIDEVLGEGGMGVVYAAHHAFTGRPVAIKILHDFIARSSTANQRFLREAQATGAIDHPGLVEVLDAGVEGETLYLVMERLEGHDLSAHLERGDLSTETFVGYLVELLDALDAAHGRGLVHRDIKPENVFVLATPSKGARVKLLDFGISGLTEQAGEASSLTRTGTVIGTPLYMSPEQARGERVDGRADLWSVGAMLFQGLTGQPHFGGANYNQLVAKILTEAPPEVREVKPDVPPALAQVVDRALAPSAEDRWPSAAAMRDALAAAPVGAGAAAAEQMGLAPTAASEGAATPKPPSQYPPPSAQASGAGAGETGPGPGAGPRSGAGPGPGPGLTGPGPGPGMAGPAPRPGPGPTGPGPTGPGFAPTAQGPATPRLGGHDPAAAPRAAASAVAPPRRRSRGCGVIAAVAVVVLLLGSVAGAVGIVWALRRGAAVSGSDVASGSAIEGEVEVTSAGDGEVSSLASVEEREEPSEPAEGLDEAAEVLEALDEPDPGAEAPADEAPPDEASDGSEDPDDVSLREAAEILRNLRGSEDDEPLERAEALRRLRALQRRRRAERNRRRRAQRSASDPAESADGSRACRAECLRDWHRCRLRNAGGRAVALRECQQVQLECLHHCTTDY